MPDVATNTEDRFVDDTVALLQTANRRLKERIVELEARQSPHTVVESILAAIEDLYDTELKTRSASGTISLPLNDHFYVTNSDGSHAAIDPSLSYKIESLWLGRIKSTTAVHDGQLKTLMLHPSQLHDDRPLPMFVDTNGAMQGIVMRHTHRTHSFIVKNDPKMPGIVFGKQKAEEWLSLPNISAPVTSSWPHHATLERVTSLWLGRAPRSPPLATLTVDSRLIVEFVRLMKENDQARCHFTCSGQTTLYAYLCLTKADADQSDLARVPIGSIA